LGAVGESSPKTTPSNPLYITSPTEYPFVPEDLTAVPSLYQNHSFILTPNAANHSMAFVQSSALQPHHPSSSQRPAPLSTSYTSSTVPQFAQFPQYGGALGLTPTSHIPPTFAPATLTGYFLSFFVTYLSIELFIGHILFILHIMIHTISLSSFIFFPFLLLVGQLEGVMEATTLLEEVVIQLLRMSLLVVTIHLLLLQRTLTSTPHINNHILIIDYNHSVSFLHLSVHLQC
jgi:hypothetical protein